MFATELMYFEECHRLYGSTHIITDAILEAVLELRFKDTKAGASTMLSDWGDSIREDWRANNAAVEVNDPKYDHIVSLLQRQQRQIDDQDKAKAASDRQHKTTQDLLQKSLVALERLSGQLADVQRSGGVLSPASKKRRALAIEAADPVDQVEINVSQEPVIESTIAPLIPQPVVAPAPRPAALALVYNEAHASPRIAAINARRLHEVFFEYYNKKCHKVDSTAWSVASATTGAPSHQDKTRVNLIVALLKAVATADERTGLAKRVPPGLTGLSETLELRFKDRLEAAEQQILERVVNGDMTPGGVETRVRNLEAARNGTRDMLKQSKGNSSSSV